MNTTTSSSINPADEELLKIVFEIPTNKPDEFSYIKQIAKDAPEFRFSVCLNGNAFTQGYNEATKNLLAWHHRPIIKPLSMMELRKVAADLGTAFSPDYRIIADGDLSYHGDWKNYIIDACNQLSNFKALSGKKAFLGMNGPLGAPQTGEITQARITLCPMMAMRRGIIYSNSDWFWDDIKVLPSGFEDHYITSFLFRKLNCIPLKKFMTPIRHPRHIEKNDDAHDRKLWAQDNLKEVQELWNDPNWNLPMKHNVRTPKMENGNYFASAPRCAYDIMFDIQEHILKEGNPELKKYIAAVAKLGLTG